MEIENEKVPFVITDDIERKIFQSVRENNISISTAISEFLTTTVNDNSQSIYTISINQVTNLYKKLQIIPLNEESAKSVDRETQKYIEFCRVNQVDKADFESLSYYSDILMSKNDDFTQYQNREFARGLQAQTVRTYVSNINNGLKQLNINLNNDKDKSVEKLIKYLTSLADIRNSNKTPWLGITFEEHKRFISLSWKRLIFDDNGKYLKTEYDLQLLQDQVIHIRNWFGWLRSFENYSCGWSDFKTMYLKDSPCNKCKMAVLFYFERCKNRKQYESAKKPRALKIIMKDRNLKDSFFVWPSQEACAVCIILDYLLAIPIEMRRSDIISQNSQQIVINPKMFMFQWNPKYNDRVKDSKMFKNISVGINTFRGLGMRIVGRLGLISKFKSDYARKGGASHGLNRGMTLEAVMKKGDWKNFETISKFYWKTCLIPKMEASKFLSSPNLTFTNSLENEREDENNRHLKKRKIESANRNQTPPNKYKQYPNYQQRNFPNPQRNYPNQSFERQQNYQQGNFPNPQRNYPNQNFERQQNYQQGNFPNPQNYQQSYNPNYPPLYGPPGYNQHFVPRINPQNYAPIQQQQPNNGINQLINLLTINMIQKMGSNMFVPNNPSSFTQQQGNRKVPIQIPVQPNEQPINQKVPGFVLQGNEPTKIPILPVSKGPENQIDLKLIQTNEQETSLQASSQELFQPLANNSNTNVKVVLDTELNTNKGRKCTVCGKPLKKHPKGGNTGKKNVHTYEELLDYQTRGNDPSEKYLKNGELFKNYKPPDQD